MDFCVAGLIVFVSSLAMLIPVNAVSTNHAVATLLIILLLSAGGAVWHGLLTIKPL
jgi:hypothetical protein